MSFGLSSLTSLFANTGVQAVGAGLLSGVIGGTALVATGVVPVGGGTTEPGTITLLACPGSGEALATVIDGGRLLVTGRSEDGQWYEIYVGQPGVGRAWAPASALHLESAAESLPIADCAAPVPAPLPSPEPTPSPAPPTPPISPEPTATPTDTPVVTATATATATPHATASVKPTPSKPGPTKTPTPNPPTPTPTPVTPTPTPTPVPPTPTPTPVPDTTAPSVSGIGITLADYVCGAYYINDGGATQARISATITDSGGSGINALTVRLRFWDTNGGYHDQQMGHQLGTSSWNSTINNSGFWPAGEIVYWITATDNAGNTSTTNAPPAGAPHLYKGTCIP